MAEAGEGGGCAAHPAGDVVEGEAAMGALGVDDGERDGEAGDAAPGEVEAAGVLRTSSAAGRGSGR